VAPESTRARLERIAAMLDDAHRELRTLPEGSTAFQLRKRLTEGINMIRSLSPAAQSQTRAEVLAQYGKRIERAYAASVLRLGIEEERRRFSAGSWTDTTPKQMWNRLGIDMDGTGTDATPRDVMGRPLAGSKSPYSR
jgi:hypothetical protein